MLIVDVSLSTVLSGKSVRSSIWAPFAARMRAMVDVSRLILSMDIVCSSMMSVQVSLRGSSIPLGSSSVPANQRQTFVWSLVVVDVFAKRLCKLNS
jgi:hypothetical protein